MTKKESSSKKKTQSQTATESAANEPTVEQAIDMTETLYHSLTGNPPPPLGGNGGGSPIPVERNPGEFVVEQLDRLRRAVEGTVGYPLTNPPWSPTASVWESDQEMMVCVDLPGVSQEAVEVELRGRLLTISGRREVGSESDRRLRLNDGPFGSFVRRFALPPRVEGNGEAEASLQDGVLEVRLPKHEAAVSAPSRVPIG